MALDIKNEETLRLLHGAWRKHKSGEGNYAQALTDSLFDDTNHDLLVSYAYRHYQKNSADAEPFESLSPEKLKLVINDFRSFYYRGSQYLLQSFKVDYVTQGFFESAVENVEKLCKSAEGIGICSLLGKCSGYLVLPSYVISYWIIEDGGYFSISARRMSDVYDSRDEGGQAFLFGDEIFDCHYKWDSLSPVIQALAAGLAVLILKKTGEVETLLIASGARRKSLDSDDVFMNRTPFLVTQLDSTWLKTIVRTEGFMVRGHFRLQRYGEGNLQRKLIYIEPFEKHGYTRRAKKLIEEEKQGSL